VFEGIRSPVVHMPQTLHNLIAVTTRFPNALIWAGGTYIMSREDYYPKKGAQDIIYLGNVAELKRIYRTDSYLEIGATVTIEQMLTVGKQVLPELLHTTLKQTGSQIVRRQITIGGALCTPDIRLALPVALAALQAKVEIKECAGQKSETRWIEVERLYDKQGRLLLKSNELVTRIRVSYTPRSFCKFLIAKNPLFESEESVILSFSCHYSHSVLDRFRFCIAFPKRMMLVPREVDLIMHGVMLPLSSSHIDRVVRSVMQEITDACEIEGPAIQLERATRFIETTLHELNAKSVLPAKG
jgi:xanthine dehydrogenase FAD-binding subunit